MPDRDTYGAAEIGRRLAKLRDDRGRKQGDLAREMTWSAAMLSRVEAGDRSLTDEELETLTTAIGSPEAHELAQLVRREWRFLSRPALDHPDRDVLWEAEVAMRSLDALASRPDIRGPFELRIREYTDELKGLADRLQRRQHQIAFIGSIGIGKSSAICRATGLESLDKNGELQPVLEVGAGGITLCEVHLKSGPGYGIVIQPRDYDEIRADVFDWAEQLKRAHDRENEETNDSDETRDAVPRELDRVLRNMSGLGRTRGPKGSDGKVIRRDLAKDLAESVPTVRDLVVEILDRMNLERRDTRDVWYDAQDGESPLDWLRETFTAINNGRRPDVSLPSRIELVVPNLIDADDVTVEIIDTRGIDQMTARADLEAQLNDPHTVAILCSGFNDAPAQAIQQLLQRAREADNPEIRTNSAVLVLPRPREALAMKDESGFSVESIDDGYELKGEQVANALSTYGLEDLPQLFFNALEDDATAFRDALTARVGATRAEFRRQLREVIGSAETLVANADEQQVREEQHQAGKLVHIWIRQYADPALATEHVSEALLAIVNSAPAPTVHAAVRREGEWPLLSYSHQLGFGARRLAANTLRDSVESFKSLCLTLAERYEGAAELLAQASRLMTQAYEGLLGKMSVAGVALYGDALGNAVGMWEDCERQWGTGVSGYRKRVANRNSEWFAEPAIVALDQALRDSVVREWSGVVARVGSIFEATD